MATVSTNGPATSAERDVVLTVEGLTIVLDPSGRNIDDEVSLAIRQGEVLGLVGESASGKTTAATSLLDYQRRGAKISAGHSPARTAAKTAAVRPPAEPVGAGFKPARAQRDPTTPGTAIHRRPATG